MGVSSLCTLQSQGHLGKRKDTDAVSEEDTEREEEREGELVLEKGGQCEIFPGIDLLARNMHRFLYVEDKCL